MQEKWRAPRRKLSADARTVPTLRGQGPGFPPTPSGIVHRPRGPKISAEHSLRAMAMGIVRLWVVSSRYRGDLGLSTYRRPIIPLTNTRATLPDTVSPQAVSLASIAVAARLHGLAARLRGRDDDFSRHTADGFSGSPRGDRRPPRRDAPPHRRQSQASRIGILVQAN